jgi:alkanesulfonate monooxygenase SsuD/methylene tetrahydromethanopterin reductase-like flavin-dependent oxidoreductase (luciferase family)
MRAGPRVSDRYWGARAPRHARVARSAPAALAGHLATATRRLRAGAGGVLLPHHPPLVVAEQFGTLAALHLGRIDLALGRAPGGPEAAADARPDRERTAKTFRELMVTTPLYHHADRRRSYELVAALADGLHPVGGR